MVNLTETLGFEFENVEYKVERPVEGNTDLDDMRRFLEDTFGMLNTPESDIGIGGNEMGDGAIDDYYDDDDDDDNE